MVAVIHTNISVSQIISRLETAQVRLYHLPGGVTFVFEYLPLFHDLGMPRQARVFEWWAGEAHRCGDEAAWWNKSGIDPSAAARALWLKTHPLLPIVDQPGPK